MNLIYYICFAIINSCLSTNTLKITRPSGELSRHGLVIAHRLGGDFNFMESRICLGCKIDKPLTEFSRHSVGKYGRKPRCKVCVTNSYRNKIYKEVDSIEGEVWKDIIGWEGMYRISNFSRVYSYPIQGSRFSPILLKQIKNGFGYFVVNLYYSPQKRKQYLVHRLVGVAFVENPDNKPDINHKDGIKTNNVPDNLEWVTKKENSEHASKNGLLKYIGENHHNNKYLTSEVLFIRNCTLPAPYLAKLFDTNRCTIYSIRKRKSWKHI